MSGAGGTESVATIGETMKTETTDDNIMADLLSAAEGTDSAKLLVDENPDHVAMTVLTEVASRAALFDGPPTPVSVQFEVLTTSERLGYLFTTGPEGATVQPGWKDEVWVRVRQDLMELLRAVYGPPLFPADATRVVTVRDDSGPRTAASNDLWLVQWHAAKLAAGQVVKACSPCRNDLGVLALRYGSDKWGGHWYTPHYERHFTAHRDQRVKLLEIGVGGYQFPESGGASLRMWKNYFRRGMIYGLDLVDKSELDETRICTIQGDQSDPVFLTELAERIGPLDIIIDDGSHLSSDVITSFTTLFPQLHLGGLYVIEDLQCSYWPTWNGQRTTLNDSATSIGFLKTLIDGLHYQEQVRDDAYKPSVTEQTVAAVHFYHNIAFIEKGANREQSAPSWIRDS